MHVAVVDQFAESPQRAAASAASGVMYWSLASRQMMGGQPAEARPTNSASSMVRLKRPKRPSARTRSKRCTSRKRCPPCSRMAVCAAWILAAASVCRARCSANHARAATRGLPMSAWPTRCRCTHCRNAGFSLCTAQNRNHSVLIVCFSLSFCFLYFSTEEGKNN